ncbi:MAG: division/cell wall cluster transcriptional repressor MraZ [Candidatus Aminicenantes bacterium]|nr:division/cell wall cluster transcriptional repressor MraZ [Candidatus Aminicenantes bacterium]
MEKFGILRGHSRIKTDGSGRFKLPSDFSKIIKEQFGKEMFFTSVDGECGLLFPMKVWEEKERRLLNAPTMDPAIKKYLALTSYYGKVVNLDSKDRILIPQILRESASLEGELILLGKLNHIEVWNSKKLEEKFKLNPFTDEDSEALARWGI